MRDWKRQTRRFAALLAIGHLCSWLVNWLVWSVRPNVRNAVQLGFVATLAIAMHLTIVGENFPERRRLF